MNRSQGDRLMKKTITLLVFYLLSVSVLFGDDEKKAEETKIKVTKRGQIVESFKGTGNELTRAFKLKKGPATFNAVLRWDKKDPDLAKGEGDFSIRLLDSKEKLVELVIGTIDHFDGSRTIEAPESQEYKLKIVAPGDWEISIEQ